MKKPNIMSKFQTNYVLFKQVKKYSGVNFLVSIYFLRGNILVQKMSGI